MKALLKSGVVLLRLNEQRMSIVMMKGEQWLFILNKEQKPCRWNFPNNNACLRMT